jgi:phosphatidate cytidylyltransferase
VLVAVMIMAHEWAVLAAPGSPWPMAVATGGVACLAILALQLGMPTTAFAMALAGPLLAAGALLLLRAGPPGGTALGALYVGLPALSLVWLRNNVPSGFEHVMWLLLVVWSTDVCAYFVGRTVGGPKLAPRISPGKTWAGLLGGIAGATLLGGLAGWAAGAGFWFPAAIAVVLAGISQVGDLFESGLKRRAGVKDSGHLIPGHGGLLDRIDGLIFAVPVFAAIVWLFMSGGAS